MPERITDPLIRAAKPKDSPYEIRDTLTKGFILRVSPTGTKSFILEYKRGIRETVGQYGRLTLTQARNLAGDWFAHYRKDGMRHKERMELELKERKKHTLTLGEFIHEHYREIVTTENKSGEHSLMLLDSQFGFLMDTPISDIKQEDLKKWRNTLIASGNKPQTVNRKVAALSACINQAVDLKKAPHNPLKGLKSLKVEDEERIRYLDEEEEKRLRETLRERDHRLKDERIRFNEWRVKRHKPSFPDLSDHRFADYLEPMIILAMNTGTRRGELFSLKWSEVDLKNKILTVTASAAKSKRTRRIPLNKEAYGVLADWKKCNKGDLVFPNPATGSRLTTIKTAWNKLLADAEIENFRFHDLRHHFASKLVMGGVPLYTVKDLLGHASLEMTQRYAHLAPEHMAEAVAVLGG